MTRDGTPLEHYPQFGLYVKREDTCCPGGPNFSKTRGVFAHIKKRPERFIGVLDTRHSQGGWAVARACVELGKQCVEFYPVLKAGPPMGEVQEKCRSLGAQILPLPGGRSAVLYHKAKSWMKNNHDIGKESYMMPNALKLPEMITETAAEVHRTSLPMVDVVLISASSGTIAAGVIKGLRQKDWLGRVVIHLGYSRPERAVRTYIERMADIFGGLGKIAIVDEGYAYADKAGPGPTPEFACNSYYDLKCFRWWISTGRKQYGRALFWNIG